VPKEAAPLRGT